MRILVVEDEPKLAVALKEGLESDQFEVTLAKSGEEGFFLLYSCTFDLVLLDVMLPGRDGLEILRQLRKSSTGMLTLLLRNCRRISKPSRPGSMTSRRTRSKVHE